MSLIDDLKAAHEAATPGLWEVGDHYVLAAIGFGNRRNKCGYCDLPLVLEGRFDINGTVMPAHLHRRAEDWSEGHEIFAFDGKSEPVAVAGNYDYEAGGIVSPKDAELIVLTRNALPEIIAALEERERLRELNANKQRQLEAIDATLKWDGTGLGRVETAERLLKVAEAAQAWRVANQRYDELMEWRDWQSIDIEFPDGTYALKEALIAALDTLEERV